MTAPTQLEQLDPRTLTEHPKNARTDLGDLTGLTASIAAQGVLEPLVVAPMDGGGHVVLFGHRRRAAAIAADRATVPCIVRDDLMAVSDVDLVDQLGGMLSENVHRRDLDAVEEGRAVQQLLDLGLTPAKIATKTGLSRKHVAKAAGVALLDEDTAAAVSQARLGLEEAAAVAAYRDDPATAADLVEAAAQGPEAFTHRLTRAKQDADRRDAYLARETELRDAGRVLVDEHNYDGPTNRAVNSLRDSKGSRLDVDEHRTCPGAAVHLVDHWQAPQEVEVCTDWKTHGHATAVTTGGSAKTPAVDLPPAEREKRAQERRDVIESNKAMQAANTTRRQWIRTVLLERRRGEKEILRFAIEFLGTASGDFDSWFGANSPGGDGDTALAELGLVKPGRWSSKAQPLSLTSGEKVPDARLPLQLLAHVAGAIETRLSRESWRKGDYRSTNPATWLTFLAEQGYGLSDIERRIVDPAARRTRS